MCDRGAEQSDGLDRAGHATSGDDVARLEGTRKTRKAPAAKFEQPTPCDANRHGASGIPGSLYPSSRRVLQ